MDHSSGLVFRRPHPASHRRAVVYFCAAVLTSLAPEGGAVYNAEAPTVQLTTAQLDAWVGDYFVNGAILEVTADRGGLLVTSPVGDLVLAPLSDTEFRLTEDQPPITDPRIRFTRTGDELSLAIEIAGDEVTAARLAPKVTDTTDLDAWAGSYWSEELRATSVIARDGDTLHYQVGSTDRRELVARSDWSLSLPGMLASAERGPSGRVEAFVLDAGRVRGIRFVRSGGSER